MRWTGRVVVGLWVVLGALTWGLAPATRRTLHRPGGQRVEERERHDRARHDRPHRGGDRGDAEPVLAAAQPDDGDPVACPPAGATTSVTWDGRGAAGARVPAGTYTIEVTATDRAGNAGPVARGTVAAQ